MSLNKRLFAGGIAPQPSNCISCGTSATNPPSNISWVSKFTGAVNGTRAMTGSQANKERIYNFTTAAYTLNQYKTSSAGNFTNANVTNTNVNTSGSGGFYHYGLTISPCGNHFISSDSGSNVYYHGLNVANEDISNFTTDYPKSFTYINANKNFATAQPMYSCDGTYLFFISRNSGNNSQRYTLATANDPDTANAVQTHTNGTGYYTASINYSGTRIWTYQASNKLVAYSLSTAFDLTTRGTTPVRTFDLDSAITSGGSTRGTTLYYVWVNYAENFAVAMGEGNAETHTFNLS